MNLFLSYGVNALVLFAFTLQCIRVKWAIRELRDQALEDKIGEEILLWYE